jgi:hypothetical protein
MSDREQSCEERIEANLRQTVEDLSEKLDAVQQAHKADDEEGVEEAEQAIYETPIGISRLMTWKVELSWGGPQDYITILTDEDGDVVSATYHFLDWFDGATRPITGKDLETVTEFAQRLIPEFGEAM